MGNDNIELASAITWLHTLRDKVSELTWSRDRFGSYKIRQRKRCLTTDEFQRVCEVAPLFIVEPVNAEFGFNFGVSFYIEPPALYPGIQPEFESVFFISGEYLSEETGQGFESAWRTLSPLSHSSANREKLARNGFKPPMEKGFYEY